jgi:ketosteroid isomerase-like protein
VDAEFARSFVDEWLTGWNSHDLERILTHYADDVVFASPHIIDRLGRASGEVRGKAELRAYWDGGLRSQPDLHFTLEDIRFSVDTIVINYRNQRDGAVAEVLRFRDGAYAPNPSEP